MFRLLVVAVLAGFSLAAQAGDFVYRGQLLDAGSPADGLYQMQLRLHAAPLSRTAIASTTLSDVEVKAGRFAVPVAFAELPRELEQGWLEIALKAPDDSDWWSLPERSAVTLKGQVCPASWELAGNALTSPDTNFLGTLDATALELRVADERALRIDPVDFEVSGTRFQAPNITLGAPDNLIESGSAGSIIAGGGGTSTRGFAQPNQMRAMHSFIGGGSGNLVAPISGPFPTSAPVNNAAVVGGLENVVRGNGAFIGAGFFGLASGTTSVVGGGFENAATGPRSGVLGGEANQALGSSAAVLGGLFNTASGAFASVPNGSNNTAGGDFSLAAGRRAKVRTREQVGEGFACETERTCGDEGSFVWADAQNLDLSSSGPNQFIARASGGFWFGSNSAPSLVAGRLINTSTGAHLTSGGVWTNSSSRVLKEAFIPVNAAAVLAGVLDLPLQRWRYRASPQEGEHLGPMAEDFAARFGLGSGTDAISTVDANGVALAAIQGLNSKLESQNRVLQSRIERLEAALEALLLAQIANRPEEMRP